jgi:prepilin-type N-terminal cleavage/methylation domain-containing protein
MKYKKTKRWNNFLSLQASRFRPQGGFTLLETLIAISILTIGAVSVFTVISNTLSVNKVNTSRLTAAYLAQEGLEIVRNIRDGNWLEGRTVATDWNEGLTNCSSGCIVDYTYTSQEDPLLVSFNNQKLNIDSNGFYSYSPGTETNFTRKITITKETINENEDILNVQALVTWTVGSNSYSLSAQEKLYNWR